MRVEIITGLDTLERIVGNWWTLFRDAQSATPFQSPAWLLTWYRHFGGGHLHVLAVREGSDLTALAPFMISMESGERVLRPLGAGVTDICDVLIARGSEGKAAEMLVDALLHQVDWDRCDWPGLPAHSPMLKAANSLGHAPAGQDIAPVLPLRSTAAQLSDVVPSGMAANLCAGRARAERMGGIVFEIPDKQESGSFLEVLFALHSARWQRSGELGVLADPVVQSFHRQALPSLIATGLARIHLLRIGGRIAAAHYGLAAGPRHYYYLGGYDPELRAAGPGNLAVAQAIARALSEGATEFHFLRGDESYKRRWGALPERLYQLSISKTAQRLLNVLRCSA